jgi:PilZ domain
MPALRPGQEIVLSWPSGATDCRVVASAGAFVLLRPQSVDDTLLDGIPGNCTLTFLDGMIPMGWDGSAVWGGEPGELRFRMADTEPDADRRSAVRLPILAEVMVQAADREMRGQMLDISAGGMRFRGAGKHQLGDRLRLFAQLPGGPPLDVHAVVRLAEPGGVTAVEFTDFHVGSPQEIGAWTVGRLRQSLSSS